MGGEKVYSLLQRLFVYIGGNYLFSFASLYQIKGQFAVVTAYVTYSVAIINKRGSH